MLQVLWHNACSKTSTLLSAHSTGNRQSFIHPMGISKGWTPNRRCWGGNKTLWHGVDLFFIWRAAIIFIRLTSPSPSTSVASALPSHLHPSPWDQPAGCCCCPFRGRREAAGRRKRSLVAQEPVINQSKSPTL